MLVPPTRGLTDITSALSAARRQQGPTVQARAPADPPHATTRTDEFQDGIGDTKTYTLKVLLAEAFGFQLHSTSSAGHGPRRTVDDLKTGDTFTTRAAGHSASIGVVSVTAERISLSAEIDGQSVQVEATRITATAIRIDFTNAKEQDPLILDLGGDGIQLRPLSHGVNFDIDGDGKDERTGFVQGDDALLVWDRNYDGKITGVDLLGDHYGAANGFEELRRLDINRDGYINGQDPVFPELRAYQDVNGDGIVQVNELRCLNDVGIRDIRLDYRDGDETSGGQRLAQLGSFTRSDGSLGLIADALLQYREIASWQTPAPHGTTMQ